jgi:hypothetical protein
MKKALLSHIPHLRTEESLKRCHIVLMDDRTGCLFDPETGCLPEIPW